MRFSPSAFAGFYNTSMGRMAHRFIESRMRELWPDVRNYSLLGIGYPQPYFYDYRHQAEKAIIMMPPVSDMIGWPEGEKNTLCIASPDEHPFPAESFDRIILIHCLEFMGQISTTLSECWRVLKPNGRMLVIVPNRMSIWMKAESTPFAFGAPYTFTQIRHYLNDHQFLIERDQKALFVPPFETRLMQTLSPAMEKTGRTMFRGLGGLHVIEVSKQLYAPVRPDRGSKVEAATRILIPKGAGPVPG